ncbi:hypothetical protein ACQZ48_21225, partial [Agrobacterium sp. 22-209-1]
RARTSGENLFVVLLVIDPTSHELGSPVNPVRFNPAKVAAAKRANATNLRSTSSGRGRDLTEEEELAAVYDKHKGN